FSEDLLLSCNYVSHLLVARRALLRAVGPLRSELDGSQDYDLALRLAERARIAHVPRVLYHWRMLPGSVAERPHAKPSAYRAARPRAGPRAPARGRPRLAWSVARQLAHRPPGRRGRRHREPRARRAARGARRIALLRPRPRARAGGARGTRGSGAAPRGRPRR